MIRKLIRSDEDDFENWARHFSPTPSFNWTFENLREDFQKEECWGLWDQSELQSVICFLHDSDPYEILWLATKPGSENQGFMKKLMNGLLDNALSQNGRKTPELILEVHEKNLKAIKLYSDLGFIEVGRRKNYYKDGAGALLMTRKP